VTVAAGLSGLAQAAYLAGDAAVAAPAALRFGVGAWPAVAAAIVAHLLHLLATTPGPPRVLAVDAPKANPPSNRPSPSGRTPAVRSDGTSLTVLPENKAKRVQGSPRRSSARPGSPAPVPNGPQPIQLRPRTRSTDAPARDRARATADQYTRRYGSLPTVSQLQDQAEVSRGTAGEVLKAMREEGHAPRPGRRNPECTTQAIVQAEG
jgi:hypothetical protein